MAGRKGKPLSVSLSSATDEQLAKLGRGVAPWAAWLIGEPLGAVAFTGLAKSAGHQVLVAWGLGLGALALCWWTWRHTHSRGLGRLHHAVNALAALGWVASVVAWGWMGGRGLLLVAWGVGGLLLTLGWNVRYAAHAEGVEDVMQASRGAGEKRVDGAYVVRVLAGRAPVIRQAAEKGGKIVPALTRPWREAPRIEAAPVHLAITAGPAADHVDAAAAANADRAARAIVKNFRDFAAHKAPDLSGARIRVVDVKPWRIKTQVSLVRGVQTPKVVTDHREHFASLNAMPLSSVLTTANRVDHSKVFMDFVLEDVLRDVRHWPGPDAIGKSIADAPSRFGLYEDRVYALRFGPAITPDLSKRIGLPEKNLSHMLSEGMNGSGKSNTNRILIADGSTRIDVEEWLIDTVKKLQTFGQLAQAFDWFATTVPEAKAMAKFLANQVIPARADYLGANGFDNWEPGCGLPYLRVTIEEGGIIANELEHLDRVLNSARSTGVEINLSAQRVHHALVDTNVRAAFSDSLTFGCKAMEDVFAMPDEMVHSGADPSLWSNKQPGMCYYAASDLDFDRQMMPVRAFKVDPAECRQVIAEHAPGRAEWIRENCPEWFALLQRIGGAGAWANRTTGTDVLAKIESAEARKGGRAAPVPAGPEEAVSDDADDEPMGEVREFRPRPQMRPEEEIFEAEIVDDDEEDPPVSLDELDFDDEDVLSGVGEDDGIDPARPIPEPAESEALEFPERAPRPVVARDEALDMLRGIVRRLGPGKEFSPRDLYEDACAVTGKSPAWIRGELSTTLVAEGLLANDRSTGIYTVTAEAAA